jgi:CO/xanthine dehydrogenase Mo-binding subunit
MSFSVAMVGALAAQGIYYLPRSDFACASVSSRAVDAGSMRGYGALQCPSATELLVDEAAHLLGIDPLDLRRRNALRAGMANAFGALPMAPLRHGEILDRAARHPLWRDRAARKVAFELANPGQGYGVGYAQAQKNNGTGADALVASLELDPDGRLRMRHCAQEIGTGVTTGQQVIVRELLGKVPDTVAFAVTAFPELPLVSGSEPYTESQAREDRLARNPRWVPYLLPARKAHEMGLATGVTVHAFCRWQWASAEFDVPGAGRRRYDVDALALKWGTGASAATRKRMTTGGFEFLPRRSVSFPPAQRNNAGATLYAPIGALVELVVDRASGAVTILSTHTIADAGRLLVPELVEGQQQGGLAMGIGHALHEELPLYEDGPGNGTWGLGRCHLPGGGDVAPWAMTAEYLPPLSPADPPRGIGEVVTIPVIAAVGNAIFHAVGRRIHDLPFTPGKIRGDRS